MKEPPVTMRFVIEPHALELPATERPIVVDRAKVIVAEELAAATDVRQHLFDDHALSIMDLYPL